ncbi:MAG: class I SAM-dependent methyltransferase [Chloroflexi bacterium]|nr:class I SAM-dependent methyltransferase [Chloroflexota bacterium]
MRRRLFAWGYARGEAGHRRESADLRRALVGDLAGEILEIGCGTGVNLAYYAPGARVTATDRNAHMLRRAAAEAERAAATIALREVDAATLPFPDGSFDAAVSTLVLCSVPDLAATLAELRRALRPGAHLRVLEHVVSERAWVAWLQRVANPAWGLVDNCHLDRGVAAAVRAAGFTVEAEASPSLRTVPMRLALIRARRAG